MKNLRSHLIGVLLGLLGLVVVWLPQSAAIAAEPALLSLKANGVEIVGDSTSPRSRNAIECLYYEQGLAIARESASGMATGRRVYRPIVIRKRIDRSSPLLAKALVNNELIEGTVQFLRPDPRGTGTAQPFYSVTFKQGFISNIQQVNEPLNPDGMDMPLEDVTFIYSQISWTHVPTGTRFEDQFLPR